jgi:hypothetical protein
MSPEPSAKGELTMTGNTQTPPAPGVETRGVAKTINIDVVIKRPDGTVRDHRIEAKRD